MAENKKMELAERIEKLILDGQKEIMQGISQLQNGQNDLIDSVTRLEGGQKELLGKMKEVHTSLKNEISVTAVAVQETVREEIKRVEDKLDKHMRQPAHA